MPAFSRSIPAEEFSPAQLETAFGFVANASDWKLPIAALVPATQKDLVAAAVFYFTSTEAVFTPAPNQQGGRWLHVTARGYRAGPAGDH